MRAARQKLQNRWTVEWRGCPYYQQINVGCMTSSRVKRAALVIVAAQQGGYCTARQALGTGYAYSRQHYHVQTGNRERAACGIFCLRDYPTPERENRSLVRTRGHAAVLERIWVC